MTAKNRLLSLFGDNNESIRGHCLEQATNIARQEIFYILINNLSILLCSQLGVGVCDTDRKLLSPLNNLLADSGRNGVGNSGSIRTVVHHEHFQFRDIADNDRLESVGVDVSGLLV